MASKLSVHVLRLLAVALVLCGPAQGDVDTPPPHGTTRAEKGSANQLAITVRDENGKPVPLARVDVIVPGTRISLQRQTDFRGVLSLPLVPGAYDVEVEKEGFYAARIASVEVKAGSTLEVTLNHVREFHEMVEVTDSARSVELARTASQQKLTSREIFSLPYPTTRDYRQVLPFIPGVVQDNTGQMHVAGAETRQLLQQIDGFNMTHPVTGALEMRVSPDSLRLIDIQQSRYSAEFGRGAAGVMQLESGMGDDHFRFSATNFVPGLEIDRGIHFETITPRLTFSGPVKKGKAWWFAGLDGEYDFNFARDLNTAVRTSPAWRVDSLTKLQVNLTPGNILTTSALVNYAKAERVGLSLFTPVESTTDQRRANYMLSLRDSLTLPNHALLETGMAFSQFSADSFPRGGLPFVIAPGGTSGSFFEASISRSRRGQAFANFSVPARLWGGRHELRFGADAHRILYRQQFHRNPISIVAADGTLQRQVTFVGPPTFSQDNVELTAYAQDRWSPNERMLIEYGLRLDWDDIIHDVLVGPRLATSYWLNPETKTKLTAGIGVVYDVTSLDLLTRPFQGSRFDQLFADGTPLGAPLVTMFTADPRSLKAPGFLNWSVGVEQMLPGSVYLQLDLIQRRG
ncbi:MAG: TonB-dependent receptor, partial [Acidobacteriales bacterium]|nr:TonB-dependent receptor [Terriglobales bacterium]